MGVYGSCFILLVSSLGSHSSALFTTMAFKDIWGTYSLQVKTINAYF